MTRVGGPAIISTISTTRLPVARERASSPVGTHRECPSGVFAAALPPTVSRKGVSQAVAIRLQSELEVQETIMPSEGRSQPSLLAPDQLGAVRKTFPRSARGAAAANRSHAPTRPRRVVKAPAADEKSRFAAFGRAKLFTKSRDAVMPWLCILCLALAFNIAAVAACISVRMGSTSRAAPCYLC